MAKFCFAFLTFKDITKCANLKGNTYVINFIKHGVLHLTLSGGGETAFKLF